MFARPTLAFLFPLQEGRHRQAGARRGFSDSIGQPSVVEKGAATGMARLVSSFAQADARSRCDPPAHRHSGRQALRQRLPDTQRRTPLTSKLQGAKRRIAEGTFTAGGYWCTTWKCGSLEPTLAISLTTPVNILRRGIPGRTLRPLPTPLTRWWSTRSGWWQGAELAVGVGVDFSS